MTEPESPTIEVPGPGDLAPTPVSLPIRPSTQLLKARQRLDQAYAHEQKGAFAKALRECETAILSNPLLAEAHNLRGILVDEIGRKVEAVEAYREAVRLDPEFPDAVTILAEAETDLSAAVEILFHDVAQLLRDLRADAVDTRSGEAEQLGRVRESSLEIVQALVAARDSDPIDMVRRAAAESLHAPVHQPALRRIRAEKGLAQPTRGKVRPGSGALWVGVGTLVGAILGLIVFSMVGSGDNVCGAGLFVGGFLGYSVGKAL